MNRRFTSHFRMERASKKSALLNENGIPLMHREYFHIFPNSSDDRCTDKRHRNFHFLIFYFSFDLPWNFELQSCFKTLQLGSIGVPFYGDIHQSQRDGRIFSGDLLGEKDRTGAGAVDWQFVLFDALFDGGADSGLAEEAAHHRTLASRKDQSIDVLEIVNGSDFACLHLE